tara:strand:+ start:2048 stop:2482 length:435 start_codon:yes stop_codon:yes gene_type:complete
MEYYLSGLASLNLPSETGSGDWHFDNVFSGTGTSYGFYAGNGAAINTNHLFGSTGIQEVSKILENLNLSFEGQEAYAASHSRAIADLMFDCISKHTHTSFIVLDDWLTDSDDIKSLRAFIDILSANITTKQNELLNSWKFSNFK